MEGDLEKSEKDRVTVQRVGHDFEAEHEPEQRDLEEAGQSRDSHCAHLAGLQCKHGSGFRPGPDTAGPSLF